MHSGVSDSYPTLGVEVVCVSFVFALLVLGRGLATGDPRAWSSADSVVLRNCHAARASQRDEEPVIIE
jgi:hypothetical protein